VMSKVKTVRKGGLEGGRWKGFGGSAAAVIKAKEMRRRRAAAADAMMKGFNEYFPCAPAVTSITTDVDVNVTTYIVIPLSSSLTPFFSSTSSPACATPPTTTGLFTPDPPKRPDLLSPLPMAVNSDPSALLTCLVQNDLLSSAGAESWVHPAVSSGGTRRPAVVEVIYARVAGGLEQPEALRVVLPGRTERVVRRLIGNRLLDGVHVYEERTGSVDAASERQKLPQRSVVTSSSRSSRSSSSSFHPSLLSDLDLECSASSSTPAPAYDPIIDMERTAWRMPVLDFAASSGVVELESMAGTRLEDALDDGVWYEDEERVDSQCWEGSDVSVSGSGWSTPNCSDTSMSDMSISVGQPFERR